MHDDIRSKFILAKRRLGLSMKDRTLGDMSRDVCGWGGIRYGSFHSRILGFHFYKLIWLVTQEETLSHYKSPRDM
jgi:hypothetical protein